MAPKQNPTKIDIFFDDVEHVVERTERLLNKSKSLFVGIALLLFLIYELVFVAKSLIKVTN